MIYFSLLCESTYWVPGSWLKNHLLDSNQGGPPCWVQWTGQGKRQVYSTCIQMDCRDREDYLYLSSRSFLTFLFCCWYPLWIISKIIELHFFLHLFHCCVVCLDRIKLNLCSVHQPERMDIWILGFMSQQRAYDLEIVYLTGFDFFLLKM